MPEWVKQVQVRIEEGKCITCGNDKGVLYNGFPLCKPHDIELATRIRKAEDFARTDYEQGISTAREICIDSSPLEIAAALILAEYGGLEGLMKMVPQKEIEYLRQNHPTVMQYLREWDKNMEQKPQS